MFVAPSLLSPLTFNAVLMPIAETYLSCTEHRSVKMNRMCELRYHLVKYVTICVSIPRIHMFMYYINKYQPMQLYVLTTHL